MTGSSESIFWYLVNGFLHVDNFVEELFFPAKMLEMSPGRWWVLNESFLSDAFVGREGQTLPLKGRVHAAPFLCKTTLLKLVMHEIYHIGQGLRTTGV
jgi:hypothetical protein